MASFRDPGFQERTALAQQARLNALQQFQNKAPVDAAVLAARQESQRKREAAEEAKRAARRDAIAQAKAEKHAKKQALEAAKTSSAARVELTDAEKKAARDARYAARKNRKG